MLILLIIVIRRKLSYNMWQVEAWDLVAQCRVYFEFNTRPEAVAHQTELEKTTWAHNISITFWN
jgi:hypothetical protein